MSLAYGEKYMADFLDEKRNEIGARLKELKPLVEEYQRLEAAAAALDGVPTRGAGANGNGAGSARRATARVKAASRSRGTGSGRRGRPKGSGTRGAEALALVKGNPGITIPEIAEKMGIKQNYLYRVLPGLAEDGLVTKDGRGWHPKDAA
jgi:CRP-like cAMP-binding protein